MTSSNGRTVHNFGAGPAAIPQAVLTKAQQEFMNYNNTCLSFMELSHRGKEYSAFHRQLELSVRELLGVPTNYRVLFMQGGGSLQFSAVPFNMVAQLSQSKQEIIADYIVTGAWSKKAYEEALNLSRMLPGLRVNLIDLTKKGANIAGITTFSDTAAYTYYCDNETIHGVEFKKPLPEIREFDNLVCDMSSNIFTRRIDFSKYAMIYAGAQKNIGTSGVTLVVVREDLTRPRSSSASVPIPLMMDWALMNKHDSLYNTPAMFPNYILALMCDWMRQVGGLEKLEQLVELKSSLVYEVIGQSGDFYKCPVNPDSQSRVNVVFNLLSVELEQQFLQEAQEMGFLQLKGHRSLGGIRVSLYNAVEVSSVQALTKFMKEFQARNN